jgi:RND family efflux transporter MFP subunit
MKLSHTKNTTSMYKYAGILFLALSLAACGGSGQEGDDKKAKLEALKKEKATLDKQIADLEKELKGTDTTAAKVNTVVSITEAKTTNFKHYLEVQGKVESDENLFLTPRVPGVLITQVSVQRGDHVSKGQVLARQDAGGLPGQLAALKVQAANANSMYEKTKRLWEQKIGTEMGYLNAKAAKEGIDNQVNAMEEQLSMYTLRSPISGTVDDVTIRTGENASPMGTAGIRVVNYAKTKIVTNISEAYAGQINKGDQVMVHFPDINKDIKTTVRVVGKAIDPNSRTFIVELGLNAKDIQGLQPNMVGVIKINDYTNASVITLPINVVQKDEKENTFVYITEQQGKKNIARKRAVRTGLTYQGNIEILSGLNGGEKVITAGYQNVVEGQEVAL